LPYAAEDTFVWRFPVYLQLNKGERAENEERGGEKKREQCENEKKRKGREGTEGGMWFPTTSRRWLLQ